MSDVNRKMATGAIWMVLLKFSARGLGLISTIILARILVPEDFGLVAMAMSIIAILELLSAFSFDVVLIQNQNAERKHYDTAWTFNVIFGCVSALFLLAVAVPASHFYQEPRLSEIIFLLALNPLFFGFENIGIVAFRKELNFNKEFWFQISKKLVSFVITIPLAIIYENYWALAIGIVSGQFIGMIMSYWLHPFRPKLSLQAAAELFNFSKWLLINNILTFLRFHAADFVVGRISGARALGLYTVGYEISNLPTTELVMPINRAIFPGYAKMSHDLAILREGFIKVISVIGLFALPAGLGIAAVASPLVHVFLGEKWLEAIPIIQILAFFGVFVALQTNLASVYLALGKPRILTFTSLIHVSLLAPLIIWMTLEYGVIGAAWGFLIATVIVFPLNYLIVFHYLEIKALNFFKEIWRPPVAVVLMYGLVYLFMNYVNYEDDILSQIIMLAVSVIIGATSYIGFILLFWILSGRPDGAEEIIIQRLPIKKYFYPRS